ncbi:MAG: hypothetical protein ACYTAS_00465 [Planctomycetota bacterium]|jgi:hypothetical protein
MLIFSVVGQVLFLAMAVVFAGLATVRKRSVLRGALLLYGLFVLGIVLFCLLIPVLLLALGVDKHVVVSSFPDQIGMFPVIVLGWMPSVALAALIRFAHVLIAWLRSRSRGT